MKRASAPGKMLLLGDYAVLDGGVAMIAAVDRRAVGQREKAEPSEVVQAVLRRADVETDIRIDTSRFYDGDTKLGVGSSAAVAVVTAALATDAGDERTYGIALEGHRDANDGRGSGVDVAASFHGGVIVTKKQPSAVEPLPSALRRLHLSVLFTGKSASTKELVGRAMACEAWPRWSKLLQDLTAQGVDAWRRQDPMRFLGVVSQYHRAMAGLGKDAKTPIVTEEIDAIARYAGESGGAAKPSGAGGGDIVVMWAADPDLAPRVAEKTGTSLVDLAVDRQGLVIER